MTESPLPGDGRMRAAERDLWNRHWHLLCHRSELPAASHYIRFALLDEEIVLFHDGRDLVAFDNRCPHRGTRIFEGAFGKQRFVCPYHGWSFAKGRLFIPGKETFQQAGVEQAALNRYEIDWIDDFLFVARAPDRPLPVQVRGFEDAIGAMSRSISRRADFETYLYACNWKIAVENALDQYHVTLVHKDSLNRLQLEPGSNRIEGDNNAIFAQIGDQKLEKRLKTLSRFFDLQYQYEGYVSIYLFPFTFISSTYGYSYSLQQFYPSLDVDKTHFSSRFFEAKTKASVNPEVMRSFFASSIAVNRQVFLEDARICGRIPADSWTPDPPRFWCTGEEKILHFRRSMSAFLGRSG